MNVFNYINHIQRSAFLAFGGLSRLANTPIFAKELWPLVERLPNLNGRLCLFNSKPN